MLFGKKLTLKMPLESYQLVQMITICLGCSGGACIITTGACLWDVLVRLTFETLSSAVEWIARKKLNIDHILHLLDDFLIVASSAKLCQDQLDLFLSLCSYLGIPMAPEKTCGPATTLSFAGIELDSICLEACLPLDKIHKSTQWISEFLGHKKASLREVQSLTGLLNFACSVIKPGRAFLRRLIDLTVGVKSPHHLVQLNKEVKEDPKV